VTVHICTGESGERLTNAEKLLGTIVKAKTCQVHGKENPAEFFDQEK